MTDNELDRLIAAYETRDPKQWHRPEELPAATLEALEELRELRDRVKEMMDLVGYEMGG